MNIDQDTGLSTETNGYQNETANSSNPFIADVIKRCSLRQNTTVEHSITLRDNLENKKITFSMLVQLTNERPQEDNGVVRYLIIGGWARELLLQAEALEPLDPRISLTTCLVSSVSNFPIPPHGDVDYLSMTPEDLMTRSIWETYQTDGGKSSAPVRLLYANDFSRRASGTNQPDPGALEKYCCRVKVHGHEFIVPRPEVLFLEYASYKRASVSASSSGYEIGKDWPEDRNSFNWANFLIELNKKYSFDIDFLENTRKELVEIGKRKNKSGIKELNEFGYLDIDPVN